MFCMHALLSLIMYVIISRHCRGLYMSTYSFVVREAGAVILIAGAVILILPCFFFLLQK